MTPEQKIISHYRLVIILGTILYPLWKVIGYFSMGLEEVWYTRLIPLSVGILFLGLTKIKPQYEKYTQIFCTLFTLLILGDFLYLTGNLYLPNPKNYNHYMIGSFIIVLASVNILRTKKDFILFISLASFMFTFFFLLLTFLEYRQENFYNLSLVLTGILSNGMVKWKSIKTEDHIKDMQVQIDLQKEKLIQSSKLASLGEMAGGVAHEINNPLQIISGNIEILEVMPDNKQAIETIKETITRICKIIDGLRLFSRDSKQTDTQRVQLKSIVNETLGFCNDRFKNFGIETKIQIDPEIIINCNPVDLSRVFLNLLNNAFDAIEEDSSSGKSVTISANIENNKIVMKLMDSGKEISKELVDKIFNPFFTTKRLGKGTGLGLSLSKGIIESHGGKLDVSISPKEFIIEFPVEDQSNAE